MTTFYRSRVNDNVDTALALRQAQLALMTSTADSAGADAQGVPAVARIAEPSALIVGTRWQHPFYWAPFILLGRWQ
jgi:CHAT domain-containing protein